MKQNKSFPLAASIIVTCYNEERYLRNCLDTVVNQTSSLDYEVIYVDDGSVDHSFNIALIYQQQSRVRFSIVRLQNTGSSATPRNTGLKLSLGRWILFVDGDDWIHEEMLERTIQEPGLGNDIDVIFVGGCLVDDATQVSRPFQDERHWRELLGSGPVNKAMELDPLFYIDASVCRRIYSKAFLHRIAFSFVDGSLFEDIYANYQVLLSNPTIKTCDFRAYSYRVGHESRITKLKSRKLLDAAERLKDCAVLLSQSDVRESILEAFLKYQAWVNAWLIRQIDPQWKREYAKLCVEIISALPPRAHSLLMAGKIVSPTRLDTFLMLQAVGDLQGLVAFL